MYVKEASPILLLDPLIKKSVKAIHVEEQNKKNLAGGYKNNSFRII